MTLYDEAQKFVEAGKRSLAQGDIESAREFFLRAKYKLLVLEKRTKDPKLKAVWQRALKSINKMLDEIGVAYPGSRGTPRYQSSSRRITSALCDSSFFSAERPNITFDVVAGMDKLKQDLRETIEWQVKYPDKLAKLGIQPVKGILLFGPPGVGKTFIVKAAAGTFNIPVIIADPATIMSKYVGESEKIVKMIFECARSIAPSIVFVDEIDKLLPSSVVSSDAPKRVEAQFLQEMDGFSSGQGFIVIFATNEPWNISPAILRPGRIDRIIYVPPPDRKVREQLFKIYLRNIPLADDVNIQELIELTDPNDSGYYSASGIKTIIDEAKRELFRIWERSGSEKKMTREILLKAISIVPRSITHEMVKRYQDWASNQASYRL